MIFKRSKRHQTHKHREHKATGSTEADLKHVHERMEKAKFEWHGKHEQEAVKDQQVDPEQDERVIDGLYSIYLDKKTGKLPNLEKLEHRRSWRWLIWFFLGCSVACVLSAIAWLGMLSVPSFGTVETGEMRVHIKAERELTLGQETEFVLQYENDDVQAVRDVSVRVQLPPDFTVHNFEPEPTNAELGEWSFPALKPGQKGAIKVKGFPIGKLGEESKVQVILTYKKPFSDKLEQTVLSHDILYKQSVLSASVDIPAKVIAGDPITLSAVIANVGKQTLGGLQARPILPEGFEYASGTRPENGLINIGTLGAQSSSTIKINGLAPMAVTGEAMFGLEIGRKTASDTFQLIQRVEKRTPIITGDFALHLIVNGKDHATSTIEPGNMIRATVGFQNTSPELMKNTSIKLLFESIIDGKSATGTSLLNWSKLEDIKKGVTSTKARIQTLSYDKQQIPLLGDLPSQAEDVIEIAIPSNVVASGTKDARIKISAIAEIAELGGSKINRKITTQPIELRYQTDAHLTVEGRYFTEEGAPLGFGPVPPVAGKTTAYRIIWRLNKTFHGLSDISVNAALPKNAAWSAKAQSDAGVLTYSTTTRSITWSINRLPENVNEAEAWFEVHLTPDELDIGRFAELLYETKSTWKDAALDISIDLVRPRINTDLPEDDGLKGKGVIRKP